MRKIAELLENDGRAFVQVAADVAVRNKRADVAYRVSPGPKCRFGQIRIAGNRTVSDDLILRGLTFGAGDGYRKKDLSNSRLQLYRSEAFRAVSLAIPDTVARASPVDVAIVVRERPPRSLEIGGGVRYRGAVAGFAVLAAPEFSGWRRAPVDRRIFSIGA